MNQTLVTLKDVENTLDAPKNAAQRIYFPLLARKLFHSMGSAAGGTPQRAHKNTIFADDGTLITRSERKRAMRTMSNAIIAQESLRHRTAAKRRFEMLAARRLAAA